MKKTTPLLLLTIFSAVCMALSLTACDDSSSENGTASDVLSSQAEWDAALSGSNYNNFTATVKSAYTKKFTRTGTDNSDNASSTTTINIDGSAKYDLTSSTSLTGNYNSEVTMQYAETSSDYTNNYTQNIYNYKILTSDTEKTASQTVTDNVSGNWNTTQYSNTYTTSFLQGYIINGVPSANLYGDGLIIYASNDTISSPINNLLTAEYTGLDVATNYPNSTAAEYKDGAYVCRYGDYILDEDLMISLSGADNYEKTEYCDCYVKVNDGHVSYIKLEYNYHINYTLSNITVDTTTTRTVEWSFYDFGTTSVTIPDEVNALFE